ncbi:MAG: VWA domain-containing protein [Treponema sp.]|nr:VWA domain-containing protein [Treponema sp.]MCL2252632.1 VWA domain-containing protein [Treponema sp.]
MKKVYLSLFLLIITGFFLPAQDLSINPEDLLLELRADGGYHLFIRKKADISSVLLTETTRDPARQADNYAYRAGEWNAINGDEIRYLNGQPLSRESRIYSLVSSTVVNHSVLGASFHIYIPYILYYGYPETRHGEVYLTDGTFLNIRAFSLPYADYRGSFKDNPFRLEARQEPPPGPPEGIYIRETLEAFTNIVESNSGELIFSKGPEDVIELIRFILEREKGKTLDIVICLDTTNSMKKYIDKVREALIPMLREMLNGFPSFRIGMVLFKDYYDVYLTRVIPFTNNFTRFQTDLNNIRVGGGLDIPEAVYEALHEGATKFTWEAESRLMLLIGDAPPHPRPRGRITKAIVDKAVEERGITVHAMILPQ